MHALLVEVLRGDLDQVRDFCLEFLLALLSMPILDLYLTGGAQTSMNILTLVSESMSPLK